MAIPIAILKTALKVASRIAQKEVGEAIASKGLKSAIKTVIKTDLEKISAMKFTDGQAILLNRLKSSSSSELTQFLANDMGVSTNTIKSLVKNFRQPENLKKYAKGSTFKELAQIKLKKKLQINKTDRIADIYRKITEYNGQEEQKKPHFNHFNKEVESILRLNTEELKHKLTGLTSKQVAQTIKFNLFKNFDRKAEYNAQTISSLEAFFKTLSFDVESYQQNTGGEILLLPDSWSEYSAYSKNELFDYVKKIENNVSDSLNIKN